MKSIKKIRPTNSFFRYLENKYHTLLSILKVFRIIIASLSLKNALLTQIFTHSHKPRKNIFVLWEAQSLRTAVKASPRRKPVEHLYKRSFPEWFLHLFSSRRKNKEKRLIKYCRNTVNTLTYFVYLLLLLLFARNKSWITFKSRHVQLPTCVSSFSRFNGMLSVSFYQLCLCCTQHI